MRDYIVTRAKELAKYIISTGGTVRTAAHAFGISKSTVHKDVTERLSIIDPALSEEVRVILDLNLSERHFRGGEATKQKFLASQ